MANNNTRKANNKKREANLLQNVLGLTGAVGYSNAFRVGKRLSRSSAANQLTGFQRSRNRNLATARRQAILNRYGTELHYAVERMDPQRVRAVLAAPGTNVDAPHNGQTPLQRAIRKLQREVPETNDAQIRRLVDIIGQLLSRGAALPEESAFVIVTLHENKYNVLLEIPGLEARLHEYRERLLPFLYEREQELREEYNDLARNRNDPRMARGRMQNHRFRSLQRELATYSRIIRGFERNARLQELNATAGVDPVAVAGAPQALTLANLLRMGQEGNRA